MSDQRNVTAIPIKAGTQLIFKHPKTHAITGGTTLPEDSVLEIQVPVKTNPAQITPRRRR